MEENRERRRVILEQISQKRFTALQGAVDSLQLRSGDPITLRVRKAGYSDRGPEYVEADIYGFYKEIDLKNRGIRVELDEMMPGLDKADKERLFILDEYEEMSVSRRGDSSSG